MIIKPHHRVGRERGFSLLEVLIALVILSVGLLGLAAMQAEGLRGSSYALQRNDVVGVVNDIADRMRANIGGLASYVVGSTDDGSAGQNLNCADEPGQVAADCTAAQMALHDVWEWKQDISGLNPADRLQMRGRIAANGTNRYIIEVTWVDRAAANNEVELDVQF
ncbi:MAG: type IV pilus modification protein PilV [Pseudomonadota bacterium]